MTITHDALDLTTQGPPLPRPWLALAPAPVPSQTLFKTTQLYREPPTTAVPTVQTCSSRSTNGCSVDHWCIVQFDSKTAPAPPPPPPRPTSDGSKWAPIYYLAKFRQNLTERGRRASKILPCKSATASNITFFLHLHYNYYSSNITDI